MNLTILNGGPTEADGSFALYCSTLSEKLGQTHTLQHFMLDKMETKQCIGCWNCWWKTPGICTLVDDAEQALHAVVHTDLLIFASPITAGFTSSTLKTFQDRLVSLLHPYIQLVKGECHHRKRYDKYPDFALLLQKEPNTDAEDIEIITDIYKRLAVNFHTSLKYVWFTETTKMEDISHELSHN